MALDVSLATESSVTLCFCSKPAKKKFCSSACRQAAYRASESYAANLKRLQNGRLARRQDQYRRRNKYRALNVIYSGPFAGGVPRIGDLDLRNYLKPNK
jgi:CDGSH-type Zn-finger protein